MFTNYSYERVRVTEINEAYQRSGAAPAQSVPARLAAHRSVGGERVISKVTPSVVYNTVDQPIFPTTGRRLTASIDLAGLGGNTNFYKPMLEGDRTIRRQSGRVLARRPRAGASTSSRSAARSQLPIFEKLFLGGEYSVRGFDIRTIGPTDPLTGLVLGGNKSLLFNVEQIINIAGPVRLILFFDAGQVRDVGRALRRGRRTC